MTTARTARVERTARTERDCADCTDCTDCTTLYILKHQFSLSPLTIPLENQPPRKRGPVICQSKIAPSRAPWGAKNGKTSISCLGNATRVSRSGRGRTLMSRNAGELVVLPAIDYWGGCPKCRKNDGCFSIGPEHWYVCHKHRTKWCVGENLFSGWREQTNQERSRNAVLLSTYRIVEPLAWQPDDGGFLVEEGPCPF
jgi:hypothetical protein